MSQSPVILLPADVKDIDLYRWHAAPETYAQAVVAGFGGTPLILPSLPGIAIDAVLDRIDGVLLTGSRSNVHPKRYGREADTATEPYDTARDATAFALIERTLARGIPLFAICRGMQELNVALGGTLDTEIQELPGRTDHRAPDAPTQDERFAIRQAVTVSADGILADALGTDSIRVNSLHRQAIGRLAPGLVVEASAPDGTIEAVRVADASGFAIGVQWHPEYWVESDESSARLFSAFGRAVRAYMTTQGR